MRNILISLAVFAATVWVRSMVSENIAPWEFLWVMWVLSTGITGGCVGYAIARYRQKLKENKR